MAVVSVIIPTYNSSSFLREALESLCAQTYQDWEGIIINNFSDDDTIDVVNSFNDDRLRLVNFKNNGIIAASRNYGIRIANGRYIAFLDSDDTWHKNKLARCISYFNGEVDLVCHGLHWFGGKQKDVFCGPKHRATFDTLLDKGNCITPSATVVVKERIEYIGYFSEDPKIVTSEDYHLWLRMAKKGYNFTFLNEILGNYRIHSGNQSGAVIKHLNSVLAVINEFISDECSDSGLRKYMRLRRRYALAFYGAARAMQASDDLVQSLYLLLRSISFFPLYLKAYAAIFITFFLSIKKALVVGKKVTLARLP